MAKNQLVALFGDSLLMDTIEVSLGERADLGVIRIHPTVTAIEECLNSLEPDLIIFDVDANHTQFILPFLKEQSSVPLLGLDISSCRVVALDCRHYTAFTMNELTQVIQNQTSPSDREVAPSLVALDEQEAVLTALGGFSNGNGSLRS